MRARSCLVAAAASVAALCVLTACQGGSTAPVSTATSSAAPSTLALPPVAAPTVADAAASEASASAAQQAAAQQLAALEQSRASSAASRAATAAPTTPARPVEAAVQQGGRYWGVYLASSSMVGHPGVQAAYARLQQQGYTGGVGQAGCDSGDLGSIGIGQSDEVAAVYFATRDEAQRFVARWGRPYVGYVQVRVYCAD